MGSFGKIPSFAPLCDNMYYYKFKDIHVIDFDIIDPLTIITISLLRIFNKSNNF